MTDATPDVRPSGPGNAVVGILTAIWRSWSGRIGLIFVSIIVAAAIVSLFWVPYDPLEVVPTDKWLPISRDHWFGTDGAGKDLFSQALEGSRVSLFVALVTAAIAAAVGLGLGIFSAVLPSRLGDPIAYFVDVMIAIPTLIFALVLVGVFSASVLVITLALGVGFGVALARIVRGEGLRVMTQDYIMAAAASGTSTWRTTWRHVLPNVAPVAIVQLSLIAGLAIVAETSLAFLGVSSLNRASWGRTLGELQGSITAHLGSAVPTSIVLVIATLGFNLLGDGLRDAIDPRLRLSGRRGAAPGVVADEAPVVTVVDEASLL
ncbi:ABC transporter permease [Desertimonas flava]|uniref:ABC transporter permease n=1 Tax=Desertimonas flava TaxID=2064846 RepID=UPI000E35719E|nr:ABC transporter permease [Desertimonas flava]